MSAGDVFGKPLAWVGVRRVALCAILELSASTAFAQGIDVRSPSPVAQPAAVQTAIEELRQLIERQQAVTSRQAEQLEAQAREIETLRKRLDEVSPAATQAKTATPETLETRLESVEQTVEHLPELPARIVTAGDFPGSIRMPGTDAAFKIGGQSRFTLVHTFAPLGTDDRFIASSIPVSDQQAEDAARVKYIAIPTRVNLDVRWPTPFGGMRTFVESDFAASGETERLRHAYIQTSRWLFGQTWSTFSDPEADPMDIDFEGLNAISRLRQAQLRYTRPMREHLNVAFSLENPAPDLTGAEGVNLTPDFVARLRWDPPARDRTRPAQPAHVQGAILFRTLRGALTGQPDATFSTGAFGATVSGVLVPRGAADDRIKFATNFGWGIGRYITDLAALGGQDAVIDSTTNQLRALPVTSGYIDYERRWRRMFLSTFSYGLVTVHNLDIQTDDSLHRTQRGAASITWNPVPRADVILEFLLGQRVNKDGDSGVSTQIQAGWKLRF
jgi:hypothetical protein